jgi:hypothetical protein
MPDFSEQVLSPQRGVVASNGQTRMKTPREQYEEKHGKRKRLLPGGKAGARQRQFEQERSAKLAPVEAEKEDESADRTNRGGNK